MRVYRANHAIGSTAARARSRGTLAVLVLVLATSLVAGCSSGSATTAVSPAPAGSAGLSATGRATLGATAGAVVNLSPSLAALPAPVGSRVPPIGATATVDDTAWLIADRLAAPAYSPDSTAALVDGLARSGVGTYADSSSSAPEETVAGAPSAFQVLDFQVHALAVGDWTGSTFSGAELDGILPTPAGDTVMPSTSDLLSAYDAAADSPGASLSRALMAGQNLLSPSTVQFPAVVFVLFASDLATDGGRISSPAAAPSSSPAANEGICTNTSTWIEKTIDNLFSALKLATPDNRPGAIVQSVWNWLATQGQPFVTGLLSAVTNEALGTIRSIAGAMSTVAIQIASLLPYDLKVVASTDSGGATFNLGPDPLSGTFTAYVTAGDLPAWPAVLTDCATVAKVALSDFHPKDIPITWGPLQAPPDAKLAPDSDAKIDDLTDANGQATWGFTTSTDPGDPTAEEQSQVDSMAVHVHRPDVEAARQHLTDALMGSIPAILQPFVSSLFAPSVGGLQARLNTLLDLRGSGAALLIYHKPPDPTPSPPTTPAPSGECSPSPVAPGSYQGTTTNATTETIDLGASGGLVAGDTGTGTAAVVVAADGSLDGTWDMVSTSTSDETAIVNGVTGLADHRVSTTQFTGTISGTACNLQLAYLTNKVLTCVDSLKGDCADEQTPIGTSPAPGGFGPPSSVGSGEATWTFHYSATVGATVTDDFTIAVSAVAP